MANTKPPQLKFYFDTHIAKAVAVQLRLKGVDVVRCEEIGMAEASDDEHLTYATAQGRALVSMDEDFMSRHKRVLTEGLEHGGIFRIHSSLQQRGGIGAIVKALFEYHELIAANAGTLEDDIVNQVIFVK
ncbi:MAG: hypothetical protein BroJett018_29340 [Chloroflexota bacterium]|nr:MAG: hypothetical protein BroJett018_29340 [Chloroflexota bacterium]